MKRRAIPPLALLAVLSLSGCATPAPTVVTVTVSDAKAFRPITWSVDDTPETIKQIRRHNFVLAKLSRKKR